MTFCLEATQKNEMLVYFWKLLKRELSKFPSVLGSQWLKDSQKDEKKCWASDTNVVTGIFQQTPPPPLLLELEGGCGAGGGGDTYSAVFTVTETNQITEESLTLFWL